MIVLPIEYFARVEGPWIRSLEDFEEFFQSVQSAVDQSPLPGMDLLWRGVHNAHFGMHSSLYRHVSARLGHFANERELAQAERAILQEAIQDWRLGSNHALQLLAELQHTGTPTRLLDFTTDPLIALWFAVEQQRDARTRRPVLDGADGRIFVVQARPDVPKNWTTSVGLPWWPKEERGRGTPSDWTTTVFVWRPSASITRIHNQSGVLLLGGVPSTDTPLVADEDGQDRMLTRDEIRACTSLAIRINRATRLDGELRGRPTKAPRAYTCRVPAGRKRAVREELERRDASRFRHGFIYQDLAGFAAFSSRIPEVAFS